MHDKILSSLHGEEKETKTKHFVPYFICGAVNAVHSTSTVLLRLKLSNVR